MNQSKLEKVLHDEHEMRTYNTLLHSHSIYRSDLFGLILFNQIELSFHAIDNHNLIDSHDESLMCNRIQYNQKKLCSSVNQI